MSSNIYKTTYTSERYGGNTHIIGLTIEFVDLRKSIEGSENVIWSWKLILDGKENITIWSDEDNKGRRYDGGCYYLIKDDFGHETLGDPVDYERREPIEEYIEKEWPFQKREMYILKKSLSPETAETFGSLIDDL
jgi:hypothetical protein